MMNHGNGYSRGKGRQQQQQSWRQVTADSSPNQHTHQRSDVSSSEPVSSASPGISRSPWQGVHQNSGGSVSRNAAPTARQGQVGGTITSSKRGVSTSGGRSQNYWQEVKHDSNGKSAGENVQATRSPLDLGHYFIETLDHGSDGSPLDDKSVLVNSSSEAKVPENIANSQADETVFDICPPKKTNSVLLKPSLLAVNKEKRRDNQRSISGSKGEIKRSGMVLLKGYLSSKEQVNILRICRHHGLGPAGFYQPQFSDGGKMHLKLMCFGQFWDPESTKYGEVRPMDRAKPDNVPQEFLQLVDRAIKDSQSLIYETSGVKNVESILPSVKPDICLVNYYPKGGRLGLHQDKDEGRLSLGKGIPIVSFSIGDSAEFLYGDERDAEKANKIILESGDVLIFGGKSRHIFHGVPAIIPDTAPKWLLEETNFRPGRLNLTFRQHL